MSQPLGVVLHAARKWPSLLGQSAVVVGQGSIGQFFTAVLKMQGAGPIITVDLEGSELAVRPPKRPTRSRSRVRDGASRVSSERP